jgi:hypothetical protein
MEENKNVIQENVTLNGKTMSVEDFEKEKKSLTEKKIQVVEVSKNNYITRMLD